MQTHSTTVERPSQRRARLMNDFGDRMRKLRLKTGMTQKALAETIGVTDTTVGYIERGRHVPRVDTAVRIVEVFRQHVPGCVALTLDAMVYGGEGAE